MANPRLFTIWAMSCALLALIVPNALGQPQILLQRTASASKSINDVLPHPTVITAIRMLGQPAWWNRVEIGSRLLAGFVTAELHQPHYRLGKLGLKKETCGSYLLYVVLEGFNPEPRFPVIINIYSPNVNERMEELIFDSEEFRQMKIEWRQKGYFTDDPSHLTYDRVHGGIGP